MTDTHGAPRETWIWFAERMGLRADLLPVVSNPDAPIAPYSKLAGLGKTPTRYNSERKVHGIPKWTSITAQPSDIARWSRESDYGIALQTRSVRAIDIDVPDREVAACIAQAVRDAVPQVNLPMRFRADSGKCLLAFICPAPLFKRSVPVEGGIVELLATGQQFIAAGRHPSGSHYEWEGGLPDAFPVLTEGEVEAIWGAVVLLFATGDENRARLPREGAGGAPAAGEGDTADDILSYLSGQGLILDRGADSQVYVDCPFKDGHSGDSGITETCYFPAGTGGYEQGHFKCLHASCAGKSDAEFMDAIGFTGDVEFRAAGFPDLSSRLAPRVPGLEEGGDIVSASRALSRRGTPAALPDWRDAAHAPAFRRVGGAGPSANMIEVTQSNLLKAAACPEFITRKLAFDTFSSGVVWSWYDEPDGGEDWQKWSDVDTTRLMATLDNRGFRSTPGVEAVRRAVDEAATRREIDVAKRWLEGLRWDGVERVETFLIDRMGADDDARGYSRATARYLWTALAGRTMSPGCQADMALVLISEAQGRGKTSMVRALVPEDEWFGELDLALDDDELGRLMRGKVLCELSELRGLYGRERESIKAFISRRKDAWTPKYKEYAQVVPRRALFVGTSNETELFSDPTGERRWLPLEIDRADIDGIAADRDQLWAEGLARWRTVGIEWQDAERLGEMEVLRFKREDPLTGKVAAWLAGKSGGQLDVPSERAYLRSEDVAAQALDWDWAKTRKVEQMRLAEILKALGYKRETRRVDGVLSKIWIAPGRDFRFGAEM